MVLPSTVCEAWQLDTTSALVIDEGRNSRHWRVHTPTGDVALRRYGADTALEDAEFEHAHLHELLKRGVPVPCPRATADGGGLVAAAEALWAAFDWIGGLPPDRGDAVAAHDTGRLLAKAHASPHPRAGRRTQWGNLITFAETVRWSGWTMRQALKQYRPHDQARAAAIHDAVTRLDSALHPLREDVLSRPVVVHYDLHPENLRLAPSGVTILDWAFAHIDGRATDLAIALRAWPECFGSLLAGYEELVALTDDERAALPLLAAARGLDHLADRLTRWAAGVGGDPTADIDREVADAQHRLARESQ